jgi:heme oxygenase
MYSHALEPETPAIIEALRSATRSRHANLSANSAMVRLFDSGYTVSEYREHLGRLLGLFEPLERAVADATGPADVAFPLYRTSRLRDDLRIMGATERDISALDRCDQIPPVTAAGLPGCTYVILGSMLGGKIIVKRLRAILGPDASYLFYGDGIDSFEALWASFCAELRTNGGRDIEEICSTAVGIFDTYAAWLSEPQSRSGGL